MMAATCNLLRAFDAVYLLNLPDRTDRLRESFAVLESIDPDARRLVEVVPGVRPTEALGFPSLGALGCFEAHLGALRLAQSRGVRRLLVLEDDLRAERMLQAEWPAVEAAMRAEPWDMLSLGFHPRSNLEAGVAAPAVLFPTTEPLGLSHCYALQGEAIAQMIAYFETILTRPEGHPNGGPMHHDGALYHFILEHPGSVRLRPRASLVGQRSSRSDIAGARWFDRDLPGVRFAVGAVRALRNWRRGRV